jgi:DNA invertase Pin-like site-specific DNA recombinase
MTKSSVQQPPLKPSTLAPFASSKVTADHLQQHAVLYVRQSTPQQLRDHRESTERQYQLAHRFTSLGWDRDQIIIIDDDLGISGSGRQERPGFRRLLNLVTEQKVGVVMGLEMSRLARNSKDWHDLFEVCAIYHVLIADEDGIFDTNDPNDRLVLGLKGIISELELHTMKVRLERGRLNKAQRGEMFHDVPVGYVKNEAGLPEFDPDESARHAMQTFFRRFETVGSAHSLFHHLHQHQILLPFRDATGRLDWRLPALSTVNQLIKHPLYAGAYGYCRTKRYGKFLRESKGKKHLPPEEWKVLIKDRFPAYITWEQYEANQQRLQNNDQRAGEAGAAKNGWALLQGIVFCGCCQRRLSPYYRTNDRGSYACGRHRNMAGVSPCGTSISCHTLDDFMTQKLLEALQPAAVELSLRVVEDEVTRRKELETTCTHRVQQAQYQVDLAERRYSHVDPANRLVAASLEQQWNHALQNLAEAETKLTEFRQHQCLRLTDDDRRKLQQACSDVAVLWNDDAVTKDQKEIVRLLIDRVVCHVHHNSDRVTISIVWSGGFESCHDVSRGVMKYQQLESYRELMQRTLELTLQGKRSPEVAETLEREGFRSAKIRKRISNDMVKKLLTTKECFKQLHNPDLAENHWRTEDLANQLNIKEKQLKDWVTRGWVTAVQRPFGRTWVVYADKAEQQRLRQLVASQSGQGRPAPQENLCTPAAISQKPQ